ncbi:hypothetical protein BBF93_06625 [Hyphomonas sp. CACIAM 19H1]|uniref:TOPRIM nucleotidyl transferase/hydrolase domain-containing protein n=1 Tax=Hyphomonas sp. CACIAM 19H1 TaxID=1873716 RepID=UPI000DED4CF4|nr:TOPRIM nucleotidyl transferase/hydrolase domain-containing protein [Hyphomonas sp. CACIAM 19H1]AXE63926.1 hypothetical protein BBF93_06625 [Hyphomonas sp. CACIAM 19H1]
MMAVRLLNARKFVAYCKERDIDVSAERLVRLERLGVFRPVFRFQADDTLTVKLEVPGDQTTTWFENRWALDSYAPSANYDIPLPNDESSAAYYSIFQIDHLCLVLNAFNMNVQLDRFLEYSNEPLDWEKIGERWLAYGDMALKSKRNHTFRPAIALLCQYISDRYYPQTQTNKRTITISGPGGFSEDEWMLVNGLDWDWYQYTRNFDPKEVEARFALTPEVLRHAYETLGSAASRCDPIDSWANLVEFVSLYQKKKLKGKALRAQSMREAANMLRLLYKSLYGEDLRPTHQIHGQVINHFPELDQRNDVRRHLEFVVNQYDLNPQPKLVLFVEGESEVVLIEAVFRDLFGTHPGASGIEIVNLQGVNNATGSKKEDRFKAIFRLVDYLHHHQTLTYLILDNENQASKLKAAASETRSLHGQSRMAVPPDHIQLWEVSLEFDNFSDDEIASALTAITDGRCFFNANEVHTAREDKMPGSALTALFRSKTNYGLNKPTLATELAKILTDRSSERRTSDRPIVKLLKIVRTLALRNPFPTRQKSWLVNQASSFLGGVKKT